MGVVLLEGSLLLMVLGKEAALFRIQPFRGGGDPGKHGQEDEPFTEASYNSIHCEEVSIISQNARPSQAGFSLGNHF